MRYLKDELWDNACNDMTQEQQSQILWDKAYSEWFELFKKISNRFPKDFLSEFNKQHFHDYPFYSVSMEKVCKTKLKHNRKYYVLNLMLSDPTDLKKIHVLKFEDVKNAKIDFSAEVFMEWLYAEILPVNSKVSSIEIAFSDSKWYLEFAELKYFTYNT